MVRDLSRRDFLRVGGGTLLGASVLGLAGCGGDDSGQQGNGGGNGGGGELEFWAFDEGRADFARAATNSEAWTSKHGDVKVNFRIFPYDQMHDKLLTALTSGKGAPDIADVEVSQFSKFIRGDRVPFVDLTDRISGERDNLYTPAAIDPWSWEDKVYGVCNELNTCVLAYRKDIMEEVGASMPFETWDDVIEAGKQVSNNDRKMFAIHDTAFGDWYMTAQSAGTTLFDDEGNYVGDNPNSVAALQFVHDLVYKENIAGIAPSTAQEEWYPPQYQAAFRAGKFVALFGPPWHLSFLPSDVEDQSGKWTMQGFPAGLGEGLPTANFGGTGQCITEQSENADVAWDLIQAANLTVQGVVADFEARTAYPTYRPAYEEPALKEPNEYFGGTKIGQLYSELAPKLPPFNQSQVWNEATEALGRDVITPVMNNKKETEPALTALGEQIKGM